MNEGGRPPRNQRRSAAEDPTSRTVRPDNSTNSTRPAKLSDASPTRSGEALPRIRNRAGMTGLSTSTRRTGNRSGIRCASSIVINPLRPDKANIGSASRVASTGFSASNVHSGADLPTSRLRVVLPA